MQLSNTVNIEFVDLLKYFFASIVYAAIICGIYNGWLFYAKSKLLQPTTDQNKNITDHRLLASVMFGLTSGFTMIAIVILVAVITLPLMHHVLF
jgi:hypothetical protein